MNQPTLKAVQNPVIDHEYIERLVINEERLANALEHINKVTPKIENILGEIQNIKLFIQSDNVRSLSDLNKKLEVLWMARESKWKVFTPILNACGGALAFWALTHLSKIFP